MRGVDVNVRDQGIGKLKSPDMYTVKMMELSKWLEPRSDTTGFTPLHYAVLLGEQSNFHAIEMLLQHGADPTLKDGHGHIASDYCDDSDVQLKQLLDDAIQ